MLRATVTETRRTFDLRGRTARAHYLAFLFCTAVLFALSLAISVSFLPDRYVATGMFVSTAFFYLPVTAAGVRRLHDGGQSGLLMLDPLKPVAALFVVMILFVSLISNTGEIAFASIFILAKIWVTLFCIMAIFVIAFTLMYFSNTMGVLLLPSEPGHNKYGPNPNEVTS